MPVDATVYPVNLVLEGRACLVVGGGAVAARKIAGLVAAGAVVRVVATRVGAEVRACGVPFEERPYRRGDVTGQWLVITATDDPAANAAVRADGDAAGVWVNAADDPASCSFTLPAVARQGPVTVAVSTGGHSPALASWLRQHVVAELGPEWATLAALLSGARERMKAEGRSTEGADWRALIDWDMLDLLRTGQDARVKERLEAWLSSSLD
ncbi:MAG TPA: bifunctional precorrin-2 dehydrogenase/sirohydrochlorin ferrochelatase [Acidimicrobiales bacterium]|jgi:precorrin-2 dehydrogenase/sirohydrochlorin ferrochelatase|nr:bifunctional precorrin-2 dehydrogenase/sirohydrochlorin ferrochelatase [Acidimicrobiales bacterium]